MTYTSAPASDRRAQRTRRALRDALDLLIREKSYGSIPVQEILNRADVGRSTFFTYFRDKDQLLASSIYHTVDQARAAAPEFTDNQIQRILSLSLPLLEELDRDRRAAGEAEEGELNPKRYHWLRKSFAERIADRAGPERSALCPDPGQGPQRSADSLPDLETHAGDRVVGRVGQRSIASRSQPRISQVGAAGVGAGVRGGLKRWSKARSGG